MKLFVCLKQVPATSAVEVDEESGVLKREGVDSKLNPYDLYALETALRLKETYGGSVHVGTMGPMQAKEIITEAFMMGADAGYIFSDRAFAGADVLATAFTISQGIASIGTFDLILCGKQTTDGDTAQVGPSIAEYMNIPHVSWVQRICTVEEHEIVVETANQEVVQTIAVSFPCLLSVEKDIVQPRLPSYRKKLEAKNKSIVIKSLADFPVQDKNRYGLSGSATQVERIFAPERSQEKIRLEGSAANSARMMQEILRQSKRI